MRHVEKTDGCWLWTGALDTKGYGRIGVKGRGAQRAHRIAWELFVGPIPKGEGYHGNCLMHRCDTPRCVNPAHLAIATHRENMLDMVAKGRHWLNRAVLGDAVELHHGTRAGRRVASPSAGGGR